VAKVRIEAPVKGESHRKTATPRTYSRARLSLTLLIKAAQASANWTGQKWDKHIKVPMTTLERLIERYGQPDFVKIDVEGYEAEALAGLSTPISTLSFEFTTIQRGIAYDCLGHLENLGRFEFNLSLGEDHALRHNNWISGRDINHEIQNLPESANSGDIYARRLD
ncbi:MAG: FkbM family methyltransferase, partial [Litoreibacter sp.]|nr:FkbM family methyltransferase [Litoreibacter sp.]